MQCRKITVINKLGLHARAAAKLVSLTSKFSSKVEIVFDNKKINGKSIMSIMMLAATKGSELEVMTNGVDELELIDSIEQLFLNKFDENE